MGEHGEYGNMVSAAMETAESADRYLQELLLDPDPVMAAVLERSDAAHLPQIAVSPLQGAFLSILARSVKAGRILEIGALGGYSTVWLARALPENGVVVSLEIDPKAAQTVRANAAASGVADKVRVLEGPAAETLADMTERGEAPFDFVFIDADKTGYPAYLDFAVALARKGALIVADNVVRKGEIANSNSSDAMVVAVRTYLEKARAHPRLQTSVIQTVGVKGHDGFAISLVG